MSCKCGKPKCKGQCGCKSPAVLQINNPSTYVTFHKVTIPASMGDSKTNPPENGRYRNVLVFYEADQTSWLYSSDGIPTKLTNGVTNYEDAANLPQINGHTLIGNQSSSDLGLQSELTAGENIWIENNVISSTDTTYTAGQGLSLSDGEFSANIATTSEPGIVKPGDGLTIESDGTINVDDAVPDGFFDGDATETDCGKNISIENVLSQPISELRISGTSKQKTYTGKNLFDKNNANLISGYVNNSGKIVSGSGTRILYIKCDPNTTYTVSKINSGTNQRFCVFDTDTAPDINVLILHSVGTRSGADDSASYTITTEATAAYLGVFFRVTATTPTESEILDTVQIEKNSTATAYEQYVGGQKSPNPSYPQGIIGATGNIPITINGSSASLNLGKNLFDKNSYSSRGYYINSSGVETASAGFRITDYIEVSPGYNYAYSGTTNQSSYGAKAAWYTANKTFISSFGFDHSGVVTAPSNARYVRFSVRYSYNDQETFQIEFGNVVTAYANYIKPITLNGLGNDSDTVYSENGEWYIEKKIGVVEFDGSEGWFKSGNSTADTFVGGLAISSLGFSVSKRADSLSNEFIIKGSAAYSDGIYELYNGSLDVAGNIALALSTDRVTTIDEFEDFLAANRPIVACALKTPVTSKLTDSAIVSQLEGIKNTLSVDGDISISVADDAQISICVTADKDNWGGTVDNIDKNLEERVYRFNSVGEMMGANLKVGSIAQTSGYYDPNDGGAGKYSIVASSDQADNGSVFEMTNGLRAKLLIENDTVNVKQFGAKGDGVTEDSIAIQNALKFNGNNLSIVKFTEGDTYLVDNNFYIYSNTTVDLNNCTLKCVDGAPFNTSYNRVQFMNNLASMTSTGYGAIKNFVFKNGTLNGNAGGFAFPLFHAQNCTFENINFNNCFVSTHVFDLAGCNNIAIKNCNFIGNLLTTAANNYREVIQPDYATYAAAPYWGDDPSFGFDAIATDGLLVEGCVFKKNDGDTYYLNGVGTHSANATAHNNITIRNCEFYDCQYSCIRLMKANNITVENNTFYNIRTDRTTDNFAINITNEGSSGIMALHGVAIRGNKYISTQSTTDQIFIKVYGRDSYLTTDVVIENNIYNGTSVSEAVYVGNDCVQSQNTDGAIFRNNIINRAKAVLFVGGKPATNLKFINNTLNGCLRGVRANSDTYIDPGNFIYANNYWTNPIAAIDTSGTRIELGIDEDVAISSVDPVTTRVPVVVKKGIDLYIGTNSDHCIPDYIRRVKISGVIAAQTVSGSTVNNIRPFIWDRKTSSVSEDLYCVYNADTNGEARTFSIGEITSDNTNLSWPYFSSNVDRLWRDGRKVFTLSINTTGDVTILAEGTKIILEAF